MKLALYIAKPVSKLLESEPFNSWLFERAINDDLDERCFEYTFPANGLELLCDEADIIDTMFLYSKKFGGFDEALLGFQFSLPRFDVRLKFGTPERTGDRSTHPILGESGDWDRFIHLDVAYHFEYELDKDAIKKVTLMRADKAP